jgi:Flp pilus assembly protein TadB
MDAPDERGGGAVTAATALALVWGGWCSAALIRLRPAAALRSFELVARPIKTRPQLPTPRRLRAARALAAAVDRDVADVVALVGLAVSSGCNLSGALDAASAHADGPVADTLRVAVLNARRGTRIADALEALPDQLGEGVRPFVAALVSCDRYGAALGPTLERLALDVRTASRQRAEAAARQLPVRLLFPLVSCILPAFALLTVAPLIAGSVQGLSL